MTFSDITSTVVLVSDSYWHIRQVKPLWHHLQSYICFRKGCLLLITMLHTDIISFQRFWYRDLAPGPPSHTLMARGLLDDLFLKNSGLIARFKIIKSPILVIFPIQAILKVFKKITWYSLCPRMIYMFPNKVKSKMF